jgi:hypothetical protein
VTPGKALETGIAGGSHHLGADRAVDDVKRGVRERPSRPFRIRFVQVDASSPDLAVVIVDVEDVDRRHVPDGVIGVLVVGRAEIQGDRRRPFHVPRREGEDEITVPGQERPQAHGAAGRVGTWFADHADAVDELDDLPLAVRIVHDPGHPEVRRKIESGVHVPLQFVR